MILSKIRNKLNQMLIIASEDRQNLRRNKKQTSLIQQ